MTDSTQEKFLAVLDRILSAPVGIQDITAAEDEYYFRYGKHAFSVARRSSDSSEYGRYSVYVYPRWPAERPLSDIPALYDSLAAEIPAAVPYHEKKVPAAAVKMKDLYSLIETKYLKIDDIFDEILSDPPF
jgi:hypothetical protein